VRNRAKELVELLADVERIRQERKKAKANRSKYVGTGNDGFSFGGGRYGGFGNETMGSYSGDYGGSASGYDRGGLLPLFGRLFSLMANLQRLEGAAAGSEILLRGGPTLRSTMLAMMRHHPARRQPPV
jgi:hypothetical protein